MRKDRGKLIYSADYDRESGKVKIRDWREKNEKGVQSKKGG